MIFKKIIGNDENYFIHYRSRIVPVLYLPPTMLSEFEQGRRRGGNEACSNYTSVHRVSDCDQRFTTDCKAAIRAKCLIRHQSLYYPYKWKQPHATEFVKKLLYSVVQTLCAFFAECEWLLPYLTKTIMVLSRNSQLLQHCVRNFRFPLHFKTQVRTFFEIY